MGDGLPYKGSQGTGTNVDADAGNDDDDLDEEIYGPAEANNMKRRKTKDGNPAVTKQPRKSVQHVTITASNFFPANNRVWQYPQSDIIDTGRLLSKHIVALNLAVLIFNHDTANIVFTEDEKQFILAELYQTPTPSQMRGNLNSYAACRKVRNRKDEGAKLPNFAEMAFAMIIFNLDPPTGWGDCSEMTDLLKHLQVHDSDNPRYDHEFEALLQGAGRRRQHIQKQALPNATVATQTEPADDMAEFVAKIPQEDQQLFAFINNVAVAGGFGHRYYIQGVAADFASRGWPGLAEYYKKLLEDISHDDKQAIRNNTIREVAHRLTGRGSAMLPKHYTVACDCGREKTF
ncbi:hypothetical protein LY76DRAFT_516106 [Colletotrichum caudatum]|nr:hypothetical protein LY76DRAFT_516106 [Colletotrichum caudatum]